ncbi:MAG: hypothetical protein LAT67_09840 [Balneolales bacterium]|nr:hypothetical protein [Balneolales bacterium]
MCNLKAVIIAFVFFAGLFAANTVNAQQRLVVLSGEIKQISVVEYGQSALVYSYTATGRRNTISYDDIMMIVFEDGTTDVFNKADRNVTRQRGSLVQEQRAVESEQNEAARQTEPQKEVEIAPATIIISTGTAASSVRLSNAGAGYVELKEVTKVGGLYMATFENLSPGSYEVRVNYPENFSAGRNTVQSRNIVVEEGKQKLEEFRPDADEAEPESQVRQLTAVASEGGRETQVRAEPAILEPESINPYRDNFWGFGLALGSGVDYLGANVGLSFNYYSYVANNMRITGGMNFYVPQIRDQFGTYYDEEVSWLFETNLNLHYIFARTNEMRFYGLTGLNLTSLFETFEGYGDIESLLSINVGLGTDFSLNFASLYIETKYGNVGTYFNQAVISTGLRYNINRR